MSQYRESVDSIETFTDEGQWRLDGVDRCRRERQVLAAPLNQFGIQVRAIEGCFRKVLPLAQNTAAAAPEVQHGAALLDRLSGVGEQLANGLRSQLAAMEKRFDVGGTGNANSQGRRRKWRTAGSNFSGVTTISGAGFAIEGPQALI